MAYATKSDGVTLTTSGNQDVKRISMQAFAERLEPSEAVLDRLMRNMNGGIESVDRRETKWRERELAVMSDTVGTISGTGATGVGTLLATKIPVSNPAAYRRDMQIFDVAGGDMFYVDEDIGGTAVAGQVKVRGKSGSAGITTALTAGNVLLIGPESHAEGEEIPPAFANNEVTKSAYWAQMDETIKITDILNLEGQYGEKEIMSQRKDKMKEQLKRLSIAYYNSIGGVESASGTGPRSSMTGIFEYLASNTSDAGSSAAAQTIAGLSAMFRPTTIYGHSLDQKVFMAGQKMYEAICAMPLTLLRESPGQGKSWGVTVRSLITPYGTLPIVHEPLFSAENGLEMESVLLQRDKVKQIQLGGAPLEFKTNVQAKRDIHNIEDVYTGTRGIKMAQVALSRRIQFTS